MTSSGCTIGGQEGPYYRASCPDWPSKIRLLENASRADALDPRLAAVAACLPRGDPAALHRWICSHVRFRPEEEETYRGPFETIARGGDCDDQARLCAALAILLGLDCRLAVREPVGVRDGHVVCQILVDGVWKWAETTVAAELGEHPDAAVRRLQIGQRSDLGGGLGAARADLGDDVVVYAQNDGSGGKPRTYGQILIEVTRALKADPKVEADLSPLAQAYQAMIDSAQNAVLAELSEQMEQQQEAIEALAASIVASMARDLAKSLIDVIPILGAVINAIIDLVAVFTGPDPTSSGQKQLACMASYAPPLPSGAKGIVPADLFAKKPYAQLQQLVPLTLWPRSTLGSYFMWAVLEPQLPYGEALEAAGAAGLIQITTYTKGGVINNVSARHRQLFRWMLDGIASQYRIPATASSPAKGPPSGTGGMELWPAFLDLFLFQLRAGKLNWAGVMVQVLGRDPQCGWTLQSYRGMVGLMDAYARVVDPVYSHDAAKLAQALPQVAPTVRQAVRAQAGAIRRAAPPKSAPPKAAVTTRSAAVGGTLAAAAVAALVAILRR